VLDWLLDGDTFVEHAVLPEVFLETFKEGVDKHGD